MLDLRLPLALNHDYPFQVIFFHFLFHFHFIFGRVALQQMQFSKGPSINAAVYLIETKNTIIKYAKRNFLNKGIKSNLKSRNLESPQNQYDTFHIIVG